MSEKIAISKIKRSLESILPKTLSRDLLNPLSICINCQIIKHEIACVDTVIILSHYHVDQINGTFSFWSLNAWEFDLEGRVIWKHQMLPSVELGALANTEGSDSLESSTEH